MLSAPTTPIGRFVLSLAVASILAAMAGCHSKTAATPENFIAGINAHFADHPDCLFPESPHFPYETTDPVKTKQMNALVAAQMLEVEEERDIHASRYTPTAAGERAAPRFCYGNRVVSSIDSFTPPAQADGFPETQVAYHYTIEDIPVWAKSAELRAVFPAMAFATSGAATDKATLAATMAGWQVPE
jgi:hypothetical protein